MVKLNEIEAIADNVLDRLKEYDWNSNVEFTMSEHEAKAVSTILDIHRAQRLLNQMQLTRH